MPRVHKKTFVFMVFFMKKLATFSETNLLDPKIIGGFESDIHVQIISIFLFGVRISKIMGGGGMILYMLLLKMLMFGTDPDPDPDPFR